MFVCLFVFFRLFWYVEMFEGMNGCGCHLQVIHSVNLYKVRLVRILQTVLDLLP